MRFPRLRFASDGIADRFQINPATDTVLVRNIIANKKERALGDHDLIPGRYAPVRLIEGQDPTVPSTLSKFPKKLEQLPNHEIAHRISVALKNWLAGTVAIA